MSSRPSRTATPTRTAKLEIPKPQSRAGGLIELVVIVALALGLALAIQAWLVKPYQIPSESMEPTLDVGQRVLVNRFLYHFTDPRSATSSSSTRRPAPTTAPNAASRIPKTRPARQPTEQSDQNFIKRIVAGPGDTLSVRNGHPVVNGVREDGRALHRPLRQRRSLQFAEADHDPARPLLHDGRQPWGK